MNLYCMSNNKIKLQVKQDGLNIQIVVRIRSFKRVIIFIDKDCPCIGATYYNITLICMFIYFRSSSSNLLSTEGRSQGRITLSLACLCSSVNSRLNVRPEGGCEEENVNQRTNSTNLEKIKPRLTFFSASPAPSSCLPTSFWYSESVINFKRPTSSIL